MKEGLETESAKQGYKRVLGKEARREWAAGASLLTACPIKPCSSQGPKLNSYIITARITGVPDLGTQAGILELMNLIQEAPTEDTYVMSGF